MGLFSGVTTIPFEHGAAIFDQDDLSLEEIKITDPKHRGEPIKTQSGAMCQLNGVKGGVTADFEHIGPVDASIRSTGIDNAASIDSTQSSWNSRDVEMRAETKDGKTAYIDRDNVTPSRLETAATSVSNAMGFHPAFGSKKRAVYAQALKEAGVECTDAGQPVAPLLTPQDIQKMATKSLGEQKSR